MVKFDDVKWLSAPMVEQMLVQDPDVATAIQGSVISYAISNNLTLFEYSDNKSYNLETLEEFYDILKIDFNVVSVTKHSIVFYDELMCCSLTSRYEAKSINISAVSFDKDKFVKLTNIISPHVSSTSNKGAVNFLIVEDGGMSIVEAGKIEKELERDNYTPEVLKHYDALLEQINCEKPNGRLSIISGPTGTGKSHLVQSLISNSTRAKIVILQPQTVEALAGPQFIPLFLDFKSSNKAEKVPLVFVLEDADECLVSREDNRSDISSLLNITDGLVGNLFDIRIVATTNAEVLEIDHALKRPGRICQAFVVDKLVPSHASKIYERITKKKHTFTKETSLAEVYGLANQEEDLVESITNPLNFSFHNKKGKFGF